MTLANLAAHAPAAHELLHRIGLERRRSRTARAATCAGWLGAGMALGGGLALLLTPRSGPELRERIGDQAKRAREYVSSSGNGGSSKESRSETRRTSTPAHV